LRASREVISEVIGFRSSRDILAAAERPAPLPVADVVDGARTLVVLEGVNDPENLGAIFRNCTALGVDGGLFGAATGDPRYRRVVRVSMGHVLRLPFAHLPGSPTTWQRSLQDLREQGFRIVALTPSGDVPPARAVESARVAFVLGAEGPGLTEPAMRACDVRATLPMTPGTDSLTVATAAAAAYYARARRAQRAGRPSGVRTGTATRSPHRGARRHRPCRRTGAAGRRPPRPRRTGAARSRRPRRATTGGHQTTTRLRPCADWRRGARRAPAP